MVAAEFMLNLTFSSRSLIESTSYEGVKSRSFVLQHFEICLQLRGPLLANSDALSRTHTHPPTDTTSPNLHPPADGALAGDDVTLAVVEAEVRLQLADALAGQAVHAEVAGVAHALRLPRPLVDLALGVLVAGLELAGVGLVAWRRQRRSYVREKRHKAFSL